MELTKIFKKSGSKSTQLDQALDAAVAFEASRDRAKDEVEAAEKALQEAMASDIAIGDDGGHQALTAKILEAKELLAAADANYQAAESEGIGIVAANNAAHRQEYEETEEKIVAIQQAIDRRRLKTLAEFCTKHGLGFVLPDKQNAGVIRVPAVHVSTEEAEAIAAAANSPRHRDQDQGKLDMLRKRLDQLSLLTKMAPDAAFQSLLAQHRRSK
jgi:hypothetical protein